MQTCSKSVWLLRRDEVWHLTTHVLEWVKLRSEIENTTPRTPNPDSAARVSCSIVSFKSQLSFLVLFDSDSFAQPQLHRSPPHPVCQTAALPAAAAHVEITRSHWPVQLFGSAGVQTSPYRCNASRHEDSFKSSTYTPDTWCMSSKAHQRVWSTYIIVPSLMTSRLRLRNLMLEERKNTFIVIVSQPSPLFTYGTSSNATLSGFCLYKACSCWSYSHLWGNVNTVSTLIAISGPINRGEKV